MKYPVLLDFELIDSDNLSQHRIFNLAKSIAFEKASDIMQEPYYDIELELEDSWEDHQGNMVYHFLVGDINET